MAQNDIRTFAISKEVLQRKGFDTVQQLVLLSFLHILYHVEITCSALEKMLLLNIWATCDFTRNTVKLLCTQAPRVLKLLLLNFRIPSSTSARFRAHQYRSHDTVAAATELHKLEQGPLERQLEIFLLGKIW